jgi:hypothetical protein
MKKILFTLLAGLCAAQAVNAAELSFTDQLNLLPAVTAEVAVPVAVPMRAKAGRYVQVSGYVNLNGNGFLSGPNGGYTYVTLTGWASFRDSSGQVTSNSAYISVPASMWIYPNQYVFQTVWSNVYAQFSYKGKPVGSANMSGSISVNGWPSANFVSLTGTGYLNGSIYVEDAE